MIESEEIGVATALTIEEMVGKGHTAGGIQEMVAGHQRDIEIKMGL